MKTITHTGLHHNQVFGLLHVFINKHELFDLKKVKASREKYAKQFEKFCRPKMDPTSNDILTDGKLFQNCSELLSKYCNRQIQIHQSALDESLETIGPFVKKGKSFTVGDVDQIAAAANNLGFRKFKNDTTYDWCFLRENQISKISQDHANSKLGELLKPITEACEDTKGYYAKFSMLLSKKVLLSSNLEEVGKFHKSTSDIGYLYFKNIVVEVTKDKVRRLKWSEIDAPVWSDKIIDHELTIKRKKGRCLFCEFVKNLQNKDVQTEVYFKAVMGYLLHNFRRGDDDQMVVIIGNQEVKKGDNKGGAGKSLLAQSFDHLVSQTYVPGESMDVKGNRFTFHGVKTGTQQIFIDELQQASLKPIKSILSTALTVKPFMEPPFTIQKEDLPKVVSTMAEIPDYSDEGVGRRIIPLVLSDFYYNKVKAGNRHAVKTTHGKWFFGSAFNHNDWNTFMWFMIDCLKFYLKYDVNPKPVMEALRQRLVRQEFEDHLLIDEVRNIIAKKERTFFLSDLWQFKFENQTENSFSKTVGRIAKTLGYTMKDKMVRVTLSGFNNRVEKEGGDQTRRKYLLVKDEPKK